MTDTQAGADAGMEQAAEHAEAEEPGWNERAFAAFKEYAVTHTAFMTEDARVAAYEAGLPRAPTDRAWGSIAKRAIKEGVVAVMHYARSQVPPANAGYRPVFASLIMRGPGPLDEFEGHIYFMAEPARAGGWLVTHQQKPRRKADAVVRSLRIPVFEVSDAIDNQEEVARKAADLLNQHWDHRT